MPRLVIRNDFRAAHRETAVAGPVGLLHGHRWKAMWMLFSEDGDCLSGEAVTSGAVALKSWIDFELDNALMVPEGDALVSQMSGASHRLIEFGKHPFTIGLAVPDPDGIARMLHRAAQTLVLLGSERTARVTETTVWDDREVMGRYSS